MEKWYSMELTETEWASIRPILKKVGCRYETSGCGSLVHVEVYCTPDIASDINAAIDSL